MWVSSIPCDPASHHEVSCIYHCQSWESSNICLHGELDILVDAVQQVKETIQLLWPWNQFTKVSLT